MSEDDGKITHCTNCNVELPKSTKPNKTTWCHKCASKSSINIKIKESQKKYREKNREKRNLDKKKWYLENKEHKLIKDKENILKNIEGHRKRQRNCRKKQLQNSPAYRLRCNIKSRLNSALKESNTNKNLPTNLLLGCDIEFLKKYLESKFKEGMTWDNHGIYGWHIDHIIPLCSFNLKDTNELKIACNYTNLQPLWAIDNLKKSKEDKLKRRDYE